MKGSCARASIADARSTPNRIREKIKTTAFVRSVAFFIILLLLYHFSPFQAEARIMVHVKSVYAMFIHSYQGKE
jgi:hypothetical protein